MDFDLEAGFDERFLRSYVDDLGKIRWSQPCDSECPRHEAVPDTAAGDDRAGQDDKSSRLCENAVGFGQGDGIEDVLRGECRNDRVEGGFREGESLCQPAREDGCAVRVAFGETSHLRGFVQPNGGQAPAEKDPLQVTGSVTKFENPSPLDERDHFHDPVFPPAKRYRCRDEIIGEGKRMVKQSKEKTQEESHG